MRKWKMRKWKLLLSKLCIRPTVLVEYENKRYSRKFKTNKQTKKKKWLKNARHELKNKPMQNGEQIQNLK